MLNISGYRQSYIQNQPTIKYRNNSNATERRNTNNSAQAKNIAFGIALIDESSYIEEMENRSYKGTGKLESFIVKNNVDASIVDINVRKNIRAGNNLKAKSLLANDIIYIGSDATIKEKIISKGGYIIAGNNLKANSLWANNSILIGSDAVINENIVSKNGYIKAGNSVKAKSLHANTSIKVGSNADIADGIIAIHGSVTANDGLKTHYVYAGGDVTLGSVNKLTDIFFNANSNNKSQERNLTLCSSNIQLEDNKKINIHMSDGIYILTIKAPNGNPEILNKFQFLTSAHPSFVRIIGDNTDDTSHLFIINDKKDS